jgi:hypothetical protein
VHPGSSSLQLALKSLHPLGSPGSSETQSYANIDIDKRGYAEHLIRSNESLCSRTKTLYNVHCTRCPKPNSESKLEIKKAIGKDFVTCLIFFSKTNNPRNDEKVSPWDKGTTEKLFKYLVINTERLNTQDRKK